MYKEFITEKINKVLKDEISASLVYSKMSEMLEGINISEVQKILKEHADEEYVHFKDILSFAYNHNIQPVICIDDIVISSAPSQLEAVIFYTQNLETIAINDYKEISLCAKENDDIETYQFFKDLMEVEMQHFDEFAPFVGQKRELPCDKDSEEIEIDIEQTIQDEEQNYDSVKTNDDIMTLRKLIGI